MKKTYQKPQMVTIEMGDNLVPICTSPSSLQSDGSQVTYDCFSVNKGNSWQKASTDVDDEDDD